MKVEKIAAVGVNLSTPYLMFSKPWEFQGLYKIGIYNMYEAAFKNI